MALRIAALAVAGQLEDETSSGLVWFGSRVVRRGEARRAAEKTLVARQRPGPAGRPIVRKIGPGQAAGHQRLLCMSLCISPVAPVCDNRHIPKPALAVARNSFAGPPYPGANDSAVPLPEPLRRRVRWQTAISLAVKSASKNAVPNPSRSHAERPEARWVLHFLEDQPARLRKEIVAHEW